MNTKELLYRIIKLLKPYQTRIIIAAFALLIVVSCLLTIGFVIKSFIDSNMLKHNDSMMELIILISLFGIGSFFRSYLINSTADFAVNDAKLMGYAHLLKMDPATIDKYNFSDLASRINSDSEYISTVLINLTSFFIRNTMTTIGGIFFMFYNSVKLSLVVFALIAFITFFATTLSRRIRGLAKNAEIAKSRASNVVFESIINNKVIHAFSTGNLLQSYFMSLNLDSKDKTMIRHKFRSVFFASVITSMLLMISGIIWYGTEEVNQGQMTAGTLASFIFYSFMTALSFGGIIEMMGELEKNLANCERFFEIFNTEAISHSSPELIELRDGNIELKNIAYHYEKDHQKNILEDLSLNFKIGKFSVIIGKSGAGKTTIINLIMGLYQPLTGQLIISGKKFDKLYPEYWDGTLSYVPQDNMLFSGSIVDNICFFSKNPDIEKVQDIIHGLDLNELIEKLPGGLDTDIGSLATKISGGQKQRIAIARALYSNPQILILDESTSQLDEKTEEKVLDYIKKTLHKKTIICVAHRRGAIAKADDVIEV